MRRALEAGAPWPVATRFDHSPEATWGPPEILAHLGEMLPYWLGEAERILASDDDEPIPFGRLATDDLRLAIISRDRKLPITELQALVQVGIERWRQRLGELDDRDRGRQGVHPTRGVQSVVDVANRFVASHLEEHLDQLAGALGVDPAVAG
jgi:hypothetical protein